FIPHSSLSSSPLFVYSQGESRGEKVDICAYSSNNRRVASSPHKARHHNQAKVARAETYTSPREESNIITRTASRSACDSPR
uniref:Uncharacterized protein n=1 Tax=Salarias fasciatus TaxID=181472 RepID=A0A672H599_SALFA